MKVRCTRQPDGDDLRVGGTYLVMAITVKKNGPWYCIPTGEHSVGEFLWDSFGVVDDRASRYWRARIEEDGALMLWPAAWLGTPYLGELSGGTKRVVAHFRKLKLAMELEHEDLDSPLSPARDA